MFDVGSLYRWESVHKKFKQEYRITLLGKDPKDDVETVVNGWGSVDKLAVNKIGYVSEIPKGGEYTYNIQLPACEQIGFSNRQGWAETREKAIENGHKAYQERKDLIEQLKNPHYALAFELEHFDFYYSYSDDYRYWASGQAAQKRIEKLCEELGLDVNEQMKLALERKGK